MRRLALAGVLVGGCVDKGSASLDSGPANVSLDLTELRKSLVDAAWPDLCRHMGDDGSTDRDACERDISGALQLVGAQMDAVADGENVWVTGSRETNSAQEQVTRLSFALSEEDQALFEVFVGSDWVGITPSLDYDDELGPEMQGWDFFAGQGGNSSEVVVMGVNPWGPESCGSCADFQSLMGEATQDGLQKAMADAYNLADENVYGNGSDGFAAWMAVVDGADQEGGS